MEEEKQEKIKRYRKQYYEKNKVKINAYQRAYYKRKKGFPDDYVLNWKGKKQIGMIIINKPVTLHF